MQSAEETKSNVDPDFEKSKHMDMFSEVRGGSHRVMHATRHQPDTSTHFTYPRLPASPPPLPTHLQAAHVWKSLSPERKEAQVLSAKRHFETAGPVAVPTTHRAVVDEEVDMSQRRKEKKEKKEKKHKKDKYRMLSQ